MSPARPGAPAADKAERNAAPNASATVRYMAVMVLHARIRRSWSQQALAVASLLSTTKLSRIENATAVRVDLDDVMALATALQLPPAVLTGWASEDGLLTPPPPQTVASLDLPTAPPRPRVLGPRATAPPPRIAGRIYLQSDVHILICNQRPATTIPRHPGVRGCEGCGAAVQRPLTQATNPSTGIEDGG